MKIQNICMATAVAAAGLIAGCASTMPSQLIDAQNQYRTSSTGLAAELTPADLYDAKKVLETANKEFEDHGDTVACRDYAYIAQRKIALADVKARTERDRRSIAEAAKAGVALRDKQVEQGKEELASTRAELKEERHTSDAQSKELDTAAAQLETEKQARLSAENQLAGAMKDLAAVAAIKEEERGLVITLSGSVLFASGKYALLNTAMTKLDQVAVALKAQSSSKRMVVEGHTDSQGSDAINQPLSLNRAVAVRDYLVAHGVPTEKITAVGMGANRPLTDNNTAENRANNRRVEIVISDAKLSVR